MSKCQENTDKYKSKYLLSTTFSKGNVIKMINLTFIA